MIFKGEWEKKMAYSRVTWGYDFPVKWAKFPKILKYRDTPNKYLLYLKHRKNTVKLVSCVVSRSPGVDIGRQQFVKSKKKKNHLDNFQGRMRKKNGIF